MEYVFLFLLIFGGSVALIATLLMIPLRTRLTQLEKQAVKNERYQGLVDDLQTKLLRMERNYEQLQARLKHESIIEPTPDFQQRSKYEDLEESIAVAKTEVTAQKSAETIFEPSANESAIQLDSQSLSRLDNSSEKSSIERVRESSPKSSMEQVKSSVIKEHVDLLSRYSLDSILEEERSKEGFLQDESAWLTDAKLISLAKRIAERQTVLNPASEALISSKASKSEIVDDSLYLEDIQEVSRKESQIESEPQRMAYQSIESDPIIGISTTHSTKDDELKSLESTISTTASTTEDVSKRAQSAQKLSQSEIESTENERVNQVEFPDKVENYEDAGKAEREKISNERALEQEKTKARNKTQKVANQQAETTPESVSTDLVRSYFTKFYQWFFKENPLVKIGIIILFFGFGFLLKLAVDKGFFPLEMRLLTTATISFGLFVIGWLLRGRKREYALSLQGAGLGGLYFILFAANKVFEVLPNSKLSLIGMLLICVGIVILGIIQRSQTLAFIALLGGFFAPPLMSTGGSNYLELYAFYTLLSVTIFALTIRFSWQFLHVLGFGMLFGVSTFIGFGTSILGRPLGYYEASQFLGVICLIPINLFIYGIGILILNRWHHERNQILFNGKYTYYFNTSLLLGTPLVGFGLLYLVLKPYQYGLAIASLALGASYLVTGFATKRFTKINFDSERFFFTTIGLGFLTLAIPLAYTFDVTAIIWAIEGSVFLLMNHREIPRTTYSMGTGLILFSAIYTGWLFMGGEPIEASTLLINAIALGIAAWRWNVATESSFVGFMRYFISERLYFSRAFLLISHLFWLVGIYVLATDTNGMQLNFHGINGLYFVMLGLLLLSGIIALNIRHWLNWRDIEYVESSLLALSLLGTLGTIIVYRGELFAMGIYNIVWVILIAWMSLLIRNLNRNNHPDAQRIAILAFVWLLWVGNQFIVSILPASYMTDFTAMIWALEGVAFLMIRRPSMSGASLVVGSCLTVLSAIYCFVLALMGTGFLGLLPIIVNFITIMMTVWFWEQGKSRLVDHYFRVFYYRHIKLTEYLHALGNLLALMALFILGGQAWLWVDNGIYSSLRFNLLGLGALLGIGMIALRGRLHWARLRYFDYTLLVSGLLLTLHLMIKPLMHSIADAGIFNSAWFIVIGWFGYLLVDAIRREFENISALATYGIMWGLLLLNQFLLTWMEPAYLMMLEGMILLLINQPRIVIGSRYLGTLFALLAWPLYWITHGVLGATLGLSAGSNLGAFYYVSLFVLTLPVGLALYQHQFKADRWLKACDKRAQIMQTILSLAFGIYLFITLIGVGQFISFEYRHLVTLISMLIVTGGIYGISGKLHWKALGYLIHLLGIQLVITTYWQLATLYGKMVSYQFNGDLFHLIVDYFQFYSHYDHISFIHSPIMQILTLGLILISMATYYFMNRNRMNPKSLLGGYGFHLLMGLLILSSFNAFYLLMLNGIGKIEPSILALYIMPLPLLVYGLLPSKVAWIVPYERSYRYLSYPILGITSLLIVAKFFHAPIGFFNFYLPLFNPLEMGIVVSCALVGFYLARYSQLFTSSRMAKLNHLRYREPLAIYFGALIIITMSLARTLSFYLDIPWQFIDLWRDGSLQAGLSLLWTLFGIFAIIRSQKMKSYEYWLIGAVLVGFVVLKLFFIDISNSGTLTRAVLFIVIALMMIVVGYFAPMPPVKKERKTE